MDQAGVLTDHYLPGRISPTNYTKVYGAGASVWPFKTGVGGKPAFQTSKSSIFVQFDTKRPLADSLRLVVLARKIGSGNGFVNINWGNKYVFQNYLVVKNTSAPQLTSIVLVRPAEQAVDATIEIEMDNTSAEFYQFDLIPIYP